MSSGLEGLSLEDNLRLEQQIFEIESKLRVLEGGSVVGGSNAFASLAAGNPLVITGLQVAANVSNLTVRWNPVPDFDIRFYEVQFSDDNSFAVILQTVQTTELQYTYRDGSGGDLRYVRVRAVTFEGLVGPFSSILNAVTGQAVSNTIGFQAASNQVIAEFGVENGIYTADPAIPAAGSDYIQGVRGIYYDAGNDVEIPYPDADAVVGATHVPHGGRNCYQIFVGPVDIVTRGGLILVDIQAQVVWMSQGANPTNTNASVKAEVLMDGVVTDSNAAVVMPCSTRQYQIFFGGIFDPKVRSVFTGLGMPQAPPAGLHRFEFRLVADLKAFPGPFVTSDFQAQVVHARFVLTELLR